MIQYRTKAPIENYPSLGIYKFRNAPLFHFDKQTNKQTNTPTNKQTNKQTNKHKNKQANKPHLGLLSLVKKAGCKKILKGKIY